MVVKLPEVGDILYRYDAQARWITSMENPESHEHSRIKVSVFCQEYTVVAVTPHSMWLAPDRFLQPWETWEEILPHLGERMKFLFGKERPGPRRCRSARVMWAWPTKELAWRSLQIRSQKRVGYLEGDLELAQSVLQAMEKGTEPPTQNDKANHIQVIDL